MGNHHPPSTDAARDFVARTKLFTRRSHHSQRKTSSWHNGSKCYHCSRYSRPVSHWTLSGKSVADSNRNPFRLYASQRVCNSQYLVVVHKLPIWTKSHRIAFLSKSDLMRIDEFVSRWLHEPWTSWVDDVMIVWRLGSISALYVLNQFHGRIQLDSIDAA